jgi:hypothetical protein
MSIDMSTNKWRKPTNTARDTVQLQHTTSDMVRVRLAITAGYWTSASNIALFAEQLEKLLRDPMSWTVHLSFEEHPHQSGTVYLVATQDKITVNGTINDDSKSDDNDDSNEAR